MNKGYQGNDKESSKEEPKDDYKSKRYLDRFFRKSHYNMAITMTMFLTKRAISPIISLL